MNEPEKDKLAKDAAALVLQDLTAKEESSNSLEVHPCANINNSSSFSQRDLTIFSHRQNRLITLSIGWEATQERKCTPPQQDGSQQNGGTTESHLYKPSPFSQQMQLTAEHTHH